MEDLNGIMSEVNETPALNEISRMFMSYHNSI